MRTEIREIKWTRGTRPTHWVTSLIAHDGTRYCGEVYHRQDIDAYVGELHVHRDDKNDNACGDRHTELLIRIEFGSVDMAQQQIASAFFVVLNNRERGMQPEPNRALS